MLLTIGMIVKNEEKYLRKCLEALQPILNSISSELIIVDTGSTDRTVEIAREFTDKVLFFEWINDFAAARNFGLEQAQGEWFMAVDADEIFITCNDIIHFFKSGEYKKYNSASYSIRSYFNPDRTGRYVDAFSPRLTKLLPETRYENAIHEKLNTYGHPLFLLTDIADHYGYIKSITKEKSKRNMEMLLKRLETEEPHPTLYREMFDSLNMNKESKEEALGYLRKGIELALELKTDYVLALYHSYIADRLTNNEYEEVISLADEYFAIDKEIRNGTRTTDLDIVAFASTALYCLKRYDEAYKMLQRYFDLYDYIQRKHLCTRDIIYSYRCLSDEKALYEMHIYYFICSVETNRLKDAEDSLRKAPASAYVFDKKHHLDRIKQCKIMAEKYDAETLADKLIKSDAKLQAELFRGFRSMVFDMSEENRRTVIERLSSAGLKSAAQRKLISIYKGHFLGSGAGDAMLMEYVDKFGMDYPDIFIIMDRECMNAVSFLSGCENMEEFFAIGFRAVNPFPSTMLKIKFINVQRGDIYNSIMACLLTITEFLGIRYSAAMLYESVGQLGLKYLEAFGESNIPAEVMAAVTIAEVNIHRSGRNFKGCLEALRRLIQIDKAYAPIAAEFQGLLKKDMGNILN